MNKATADKIEVVMGAVGSDIDNRMKVMAISGKIARLIDQRNAIQKLINVLDEQRNRLEEPHYKGVKGDE